MNENPIIFGTDGWRGKLDAEINETTVGMAAQAFSDYLKQRYAGRNDLKTAVGFDGRNRSSKFAEQFAGILMSNGITCYLSDNVIPTPTLSFFVKTQNLDAGVMITASHNPPEYNGIKFKDSYGGPFLTEETLKVEKLIGINTVPTDLGTPIISDMMECYYNQLERYVDFGSIRNAGIKIAIDSMSGAGRRYLEILLRKHGCQAETIYNECEEDFSGRSPEPIEKNLMPLSWFLASHPGFSFGAATDGDADRAGILLENGKWLSAQYTILLLNDYIVNGKELTGGLVKTSSVTDKIQLFASKNRPVYDVQVGFKYICEMMISHDIAIGCEESGGFGFKDHIPERDGLLSALIFAEMLAKSGHHKLSDYCESKKSVLGDIYYHRIDLNYDKADRVEILPALAENPPAKLAGFEVNHLKKFFSSRGVVNGIKIILAGSPRWLLIRASETEPIVRFYAEGENRNDVKKILDSGKKLINC